MILDELVLHTGTVEEVRGLSWGHAEGCSLDPTTKKKSKATTRSLFAE
jgi:hypothetical protein